MSVTPQAVPDAPPVTPRRPMNYRWLAVLVVLAIGVSILLVYAENRVYEPATPFLGGTGDHVHAFALDPNNDAHFYVGTHYGFFRTNDGGAQWARLNGTGGITSDLVATSISISPIDGRTVYATGYTLSSGNAAGVFVTHDDGAHWQGLPTGGTGNLPDPRLLFVSAGWATAGEAYAYSIDYGLYRTTDGGAHWRQVAQPFAGQVSAFVPALDCSGVPGAHAMTGTACPERLIVATTQGLWLGASATSDPIAFSANPTVTGYVYSVAIHRGVTPTVYASTAQGVFSAAGPSAPFAQDDNISTGAPTLTAIAVSGASGRTVFGVTAQNVVVVSTDGGKTWQIVGASLLTRGISQLTSGLRTATGSNTPQWAGGQNIFLTQLQAPTGDTQSVYAAISFPVQIFHTIDDGQQWSELG